MDKVEKAVIDLDGEWPDGNVGISSLGYYLGQVGEPTLRRSTASSTMHICTRSEFMEARKRLENKPSWDTAPKGANWLTQDEVGNYSFWSHKPYHRRKSGSWVADDGPAWTVASKGCVFGDWHQSLEPRPQPDNKEGEGVEWDEPTEGFHYINGQALPPVGVECEVSIEGGISTTCKVISYYDDMVWLDLDSRHPVRMIQECRFRPIQSHRDKCIEAATKVLNEMQVITTQRFISELYDAGCLRLPNDKEGE